MRCARALMLLALAALPFAGAHVLAGRALVLRSRALPVRVPDLTGLASGASAGPVAPALPARGVREVTVEVAADGRLRVAGARRLAFWRGVNLPADTEPYPLQKKVYPVVDEVLVRVTVRGESPLVKVRRQQFTDFDSLRDWLRKTGEIVARDPDWRCQIVIQGKTDAPFGLVAAATVAALESGLPVVFQAPPAELDKGGAEWRESLDAPPKPRPKPDPEALAALVRARHARASAGEAIGIEDLCDYLAIEAEKEPWGGEGSDLSDLGVRIRADAAVEYGQVQRVLLACMTAGVWRVSFAARAHGCAIVLGRVTERPEPSYDVILWDDTYDLEPLEDQDAFEAAPLSDAAEPAPPAP